MADREDPGDAWRRPRTLIPPRDTLTRVEGVETWLRRNRHFRAASWFGLFLASVQFVLQLPRIVSGFQLEAEWAQRNWVALSSLLVFVGAIVLFAASRTWVQESREPFRYTCSVAQFEVVPPIPHPSFEIGSQLRYDLTERLNERIARLSFLDEEAVSAGVAGGRSHIHVSGHLIVRPKSKGPWMVEATPRIRMGPGSSPETLGHPVKFSLDNRTVVAEGDAEKDVQRIDEPTLGPGEYEKILERIYFSISSELYKQVRHDVETKIRLLPTRRLRAIAYLHEAEDYLRSNTLDAYEEARSLFAASLDLFDPRQKRAHRPLYLHWFRALSITISAAGHLTRQILSRPLPRLGKGEILTARAEVGYAISLIDRRVLAGLSGHRINAIFPARPSVKRALTRLSRTSPRTPGSLETRFNAFVTSALAAHYLGRVRDAQAALQEARTVDPSRAETDARFLFAAGLVEVRPRWALPYLRRAVEQDPRLEIAQFEFALKTEYVWRMKPKLEGGVATSIVVAEYEDLLNVNPGNIRAWANLGYVYWLLGPEHLDAAEEVYLRGREYKQMRKTTQVAELDHGLARVYAEKGDFNKAYLHYLRAISGRLSLGLDHGSETSAQFYFFDFIGPDMLDRFEAFYGKVKEHAADREMLGKQNVPPRVRDAVVAFALNDSGEAYRDYYSRSGERGKLTTARSRFEQAARCNAQAVMPRFNKYLLESHEISRGTFKTPEETLASLTQSYAEVNRLVREVWNLERGWADAECARILASARLVERLKREGRRLKLVRQPPNGSLLQKLSHKTTVSRTATSPKTQSIQEGFEELTRTAAEDIGRGLPMLEAAVGSDAMTASPVTSRPAQPEADPETPEESSDARERDITALRRLAPHQWLWDKDDFNWTALHSRYTKDGRWEEEVDDLHVRALFAWAAARSVSLAGQTTEPEPRERRRIGKLLDHIRKTFWPGDFLLLRLCANLGEPVKEDLKEVIRSWLTEDPIAYWALEMAWNEKWGDGDLFDKNEKREFLEQAKHVPDASRRVRSWIKKKEEELGEAGDPKLVGKRPAVVHLPKDVGA